MCALLDRRRNRAFGRLDVAALLTAVALLVAIFVPHAAARTKARGSRIYCLTNLKQIALGLQLWANQHDQQYPMRVSWQEGGSKELSLRGWVAPTFWAASNELYNPKILVCPSDKRRLPPPTSFASLTDRKVSYFLGLDATPSNGESTLAGDRNLEMSGSPVSPGLVLINDPDKVSWSPKSLHLGAGNIALSDGSVHQVTSKHLQSSLQASQPTNTLIVP